jgi:hypothetical protein
VANNEPVPASANEPHALVESAPALRIGLGARAA